MGEREWCEWGSVNGGKGVEEYGSSRLGIQLEDMGIRKTK
jgi:hypothetical protein